VTTKVGVIDQNRITRAGHRGRDRHPFKKKEDKRIQARVGKKKTNKGPNKRKKT